MKIRNSLVVLALLGGVMAPVKATPLLAQLPCDPMPGAQGTPTTRPNTAAPPPPNGGATSANNGALGSAMPETDTANCRFVNRGKTGEVFDYKLALVPGKTNILDFSSEYCGPCRRLAPQLAELARKNPNVVVSSFDINRPGVHGIDWSSPLARQYRLHSIPHLKVFDEKGHLLAEGPEARTMVTKMMQAAGQN